MLQLPPEPAGMRDKMVRLLDSAWHGSPPAHIRPPIPVYVLPETPGPDALEKMELVEWAYLITCEDDEIIEVRVSASEDGVSIFCGQTPRTSFYLLQKAIQTEQWPHPTVHEMRFLESPELGFRALRLIGPHPRVIVQELWSENRLVVCMTEPEFGEYTARRANDARSG